MNLVTVFLVELFLLCSAIILALALKRYRKAFKDNQNYQENKKIMYINFFGAIGHICVEVVVTSLIEYELKNQRLGTYYEFPVV